LRIDVELLWHPRVNDDPVHQFVRTELAGLCAGGRIAPDGAEESSP
jgi:hypothetical protein